MWFNERINGRVVVSKFAFVEGNNFEEKPPSIVEDLTNMYIIIEL